VSRLTGGLVLASLLLSPAYCLASHDTDDDPDSPASSADRLETVVIEATRLGGPEVSPTGANDYAVTAQDI
jgi:hypothetical protein